MNATVRFTVIGSLFGHDISDGAVGPGSSFKDAFMMLENLGFYERVTDIKRCPAASNMALISATSRVDGRMWTAEGTRWQ